MKSSPNFYASVMHDNAEERKCSYCGSPGRWSGYAGQFTAWDDISQRFACKDLSHCEGLLRRRRMEIIDSGWEHRFIRGKL